MDRLQPLRNRRSQSLGSWPRIYLHQGSGQDASCLEGLVRFAQAQAADPAAPDFGSIDEFTKWSQSLPVVYDDGESPTVAGCDPRQRARGWAEAAGNGLNCWEATGLFLAAAIKAQAPIEVHIYDVGVNGQRHVFPATRNLGEVSQPQAVVLQPPVVAQGLVKGRGRVRGQGFPAVWGKARAQEFFRGLVQSERPRGQRVRAQGTMGTEEDAHQWGHLELRLRHDLQLWEATQDVADERLPDLGLHRSSTWRQTTLPNWLASEVPSDLMTQLGYLAALQEGGFVFAWDSWAAGRRRLYVAQFPDEQTARLPPGAPLANAWYNDLLGGLHVAGTTVLQALGGSAGQQVAKKLEEVEGSNLPGWARFNAPTAPRTKPQAGPEGSILAGAPPDNGKRTRRENAIQRFKKKDSLKQNKPRGTEQTPIRVKSEPGGAY